MQTWFWFGCKRMCVLPLSHIHDVNPPLHQHSTFVQLFPILPSPVDRQPRLSMKPSARCVCWRVLVWLHVALTHCCHSPVWRLVAQLYHTTDAGLIEACREKAVHYSASTCVTALIADDLVTIAHVADSRVCSKPAINTHAL